MEVKHWTAKQHFTFCTLIYAESQVTHREIKMEYQCELVVELMFSSLVFRFHTYIPHQVKQETRHKTDNKPVM